MNSVGKGVIKKDAMALVTGQPVYCDDMRKLKVLTLPLRKEFLELKLYIHMRMFQLLVLHWQGNLILNLVLMIVES